MYYQYFGLNEAPFSIAVNPRYLYMSARHRDALAHLLYGVGAGGGFILLTGEVGTGKTTINRCLLEQLPENTDIAIILNPALSASELLATACDELGIGYEADNHSLKTLTDNLREFLLNNHRRGRNTVLMIDEAQHLDFDVLEQIRLLTNLETNSEKLLQIILIGQPELAQMLQRPELRQLNQRITARYNLEPLNLNETGAYIRHRLQVAGLAPGRELFPADVVRDVYRRTRGIPRLINLLCDRVLLGAYGRNKSRADRAMLKVAALEVMGPEAAAAQRSKRPIVMGLAVVLALAVAGWWGWQRGPWRMSPQQNAVPAAGLPVPDSSGTSGASDRLATVPPPPGGEHERGSTPEVAAVSLSAAPMDDIQEPALPERQPEDAPIDLGPITPADPQSPLWLLSPGQGLATLWALNSTAAQPPSLCATEAALAARIDGVPVCERAIGYGLAELRYLLSRPLLLQLRTADNSAASAVLLGVEGGSASLWGTGGIAELDVGELAALWTGEYSYLWRPPQGFVAPVALWHRGPVVLEVAALFARLDGQSEPLSGDTFNRALDARVRLFQQRQGLEVDGVVGVKTLLRLNEALGIDPGNAAVRGDLLADDRGALPR